MILRRLQHGRRDIGATGVALSSTVTGSLPNFLTGALAVQVSATLGLTESAIGLVAASFFAVSAFASYPGGRLTERVGAERGMLGAVILGIVSLTTMGTAGNYGVLLAGVVVGGVANGLVQPAANLSLARNVRRHRQGIAFGAKQAAIPMCTLLGGLAVPTIALTLGWRWAFIGAAMFGLILSIILWRSRSTPPARVSGTPRPRQASGRRDLLLLAIGGGFASATMNAMASFLVLGAVYRGVSPGAAGVLLAVGSGINVSSRIGLGWLADRGRIPLGGGVVLLLCVAGTAFATLATDTPVWLYVGAAIVGYGLGWAWPGLYTLAVVRRNPDTPGSATGVTQAGIYAGGVIGPPAFGLIVQHVSFGAAWATTAVFAITAAVILGTQLRVRY